VGASKPDPRLFEDALAKLGLMAEECIYIDDKPAFAQAATNHLLHGITYTTPIALMAELRRRKVAF
jgi:putative hydrolase of the HAD superfamily